MKRRIRMIPKRILWFLEDLLILPLEILDCLISRKDKKMMNEYGLKTIQTNDIHLKAEIYSELINDMQAKIAEFEREHPECMNDEIQNINRQLSDARMGSRVYVDEYHFQEWEDLLLSADAAMIKNEIFGL